MKKIVDYVVLEDYPCDLPKKVLTYIAKGWEPLGGVSGSHKPNSVLICVQAMVLYQKSDS